MPRKAKNEMAACSGMPLRVGSSDWLKLIEQVQYGHNFANSRLPMPLDEEALCPNTNALGVLCTQVTVQDVHVSETLHGDTLTIFWQYGAIGRKELRPDAPDALWVIACVEEVGANVLKGKFLPATLGLAQEMIANPKVRPCTSSVAIGGHRLSFNVEAEPRAAVCRRESARANG